MTNFNQLECFISALHHFDTVKYVYDIASCAKVLLYLKDCMQGTWKTSLVLLDNSCPVLRLCSAQNVNASDNNGIWTYNIVAAVHNVT